MDEVIVLSSDPEEDLPPKPKRPRLSSRQFASSSSSSAHASSSSRKDPITRATPTPTPGPPPFSRTPSGSSSQSGDGSGTLSPGWKEGEVKPSYYVQAFEEMMDVVLEHEGFLFSAFERGVFGRYKQMEYESRYIFVRLFIRKNGWFRLSKLGYYKDVRNMEEASANLCIECTQEELKGFAGFLEKKAEIEEVEVTGDVKTEGDAIEVDGIDGGDVKPSASSVTDASTTADIKDEIPPTPVERTEPARPIKDDDEGLEETAPVDELCRFAFNEQQLSIGDLDELFGLLSQDELKLVAKDMKAPKTGTTRDSICSALKRTTSSQTTLFGTFTQRSPNCDPRPDQAKKLDALTRAKRQLGLNFDSKGQKLRQSDQLRSRVLSQTGPCIKLSPSIISLFTRLHLIFHRSLFFTEKTLTSPLLARFKIRNYPAYEVKRSFRIFESRRLLLEYEEAARKEKKMEDFLGESVDSWKSSASNIGSGEGKEFRRKQEREKGLREGLKLFEEVWPVWKKFVGVMKEEERRMEKITTKSENGQARWEQDEKVAYYKKRFHPGWPLTRVVYKGAHILSRFHKYEREVEVLRTLLDQKCFRRGKRGAWYDRLALVLMNHLEDDKRHRRKEALEVCMEGLRDPNTHLIYHNSLQRRIKRLESLLKIPLSKQHDFSYACLRDATKRTMVGEKLSAGETGRKSVWRALDGGEVGVEELCLEWYKREKWKGFHSENGILTTIFCLLFWDVIFAPVDGVFETSYQSAPLDLSTDAFSIMRSDIIRRRLIKIEEGRGKELLLETDVREREKKTWCVGVRWDYEREDLCEVVECIGGQALSAICRVFAEEWGHRVGGIPDLCLWNAEKGKCRFVEVKGPGDRLSETQKVWIDVLLAAGGVEVELCHVVINGEGVTESDDEDDVDDDVEGTPSPSGRGGKKGKKKRKQTVEL